MDQEHSEQDHAEVEVGPSPAPSPPPPAPQPAEHEQEPADNQTTSGGGDGHSENPAWVRRHSYISLAFTLVIAIATGLYTWNSNRQLSVMRDTLKQMKSSDAATAQIVEANKSLAKTAADNLSESKRQADAALVASQEQASRALEESKRQSAASQDIARGNLDVARRQLLESQQAKVFVEGISINLDQDPNPVNGQFHNVGTLAAEDFAWNVAYTTNPAKVVPVKLKRMTNPIVPGAIQPFNGLISLPSGASAAIKKGDVPLWLLVPIRYKDKLSHEERAATACFTYDAKFGNTANCENTGGPLPRVAVEETP